MQAEMRTRLLYRSVLVVGAALALFAGLIYDPTVSAGDSSICDDVQCIARQYEISLSGRRVVNLYRLQNQNIMLYGGFFLFALGAFGSWTLRNKNFSLKSPSQNVGDFSGVREIDNEQFRLWLSNKYDIKRNDLLNKYVVGNNLFDTLSDAFVYVFDVEQSEFEKLAESSQQRSANIKRIGSAFGLLLIIYFAYSLFGAISAWRQEQKEASEKAVQAAKSLKELTSALKKVGLSVHPKSQLLSGEGIDDFVTDQGVDCAYNVAIKKNYGHLGTIDSTETRYKKGYSVQFTINDRSEDVEQYYERQLELNRFKRSGVGDSLRFAESSWAYFKNDELVQMTTVKSGINDSTEYAKTNLTICYAK